MLILSSRTSQVVQTNVHTVKAECECSLLEITVIITDMVREFLVEKADVLVQ